MFKNEKKKKKKFPKQREKKSEKKKRKKKRKEKKRNHLQLELYNRIRDTQDGSRFVGDITKITVEIFKFKSHR